MSRIFDNRVKDSLARNSLGTFGLLGSLRFWQCKHCRLLRSLSLTRQPIDPKSMPKASFIDGDSYLHINCIHQRDHQYPSVANKKLAAQATLLRSVPYFTTATYGSIQKRTNRTSSLQKYNHNPRPNSTILCHALPHVS